MSETCFVEEVCAGEHSGAVDVDEQFVFDTGPLVASQHQPN